MGNVFGYQTAYFCVQFKEGLPWIISFTQFLMLNNTNKTTYMRVKLVQLKQDTENEIV